MNGVLEVAQPLTFVQGERVNTARRFMLNTLTLLFALALVVTWLVRRQVGRPLSRFVEAIRDLGEGDLSQRLDEEPDGSELAEAAREFNRMVGRLAAAMDEAERETEERLALEKRMREREHRAALGTLATGVAHQLGTPFSVIGGRADVLLHRGGHSEKDARSLKIIREQTNRIFRIVRNLLQFARRPERPMQPTEVGSVVTGALELVEPDLNEAEIRIDRHLETPAWAEADPELLEEVLVTLLENALQAVTEPDAAPWIRDTGDDRDGCRERRDSGRRGTTSALSSAWRASGVAVRAGSGGHDRRILPAVRCQVVADPIPLFQALSGLRKAMHDHEG